MAIDERWLGRGLAALGLVLCVATWLVVEDASDEGFRRLVGRHVPHIEFYNRVCHHILMPAWPNSAGTEPLAFAGPSTYMLPSDRYWANSGRTRPYSQMRAELCNPVDTAKILAAAEVPND